MGVRVADLVLDHLPQGAHMVDLTGQDFHAVLPTRPDATYSTELPSSGQSAERGVLVLASTGPEGNGTSLDQAAVAVSPGSCLIVLLGWSALELPWAKLADLLVRHGLQVVAVVPLSSAGAHAAVVARRPPVMGQLFVPSQHLEGRPPTTRATAGAEWQLALRLAAERAFLDIQERALRERLRLDQQRLAETRASTAALSEELKRLTSEVTALRERMAAAQADATSSRAEAEAERRRRQALESSTTFRASRAFADARSRRGLLRLPIELGRIARGH